MEILLVIDKETERAKVFKDGAQISEEEAIGVLDSVLSYAIEDPIREPVLVG